MASDLKIKCKKCSREDYSQNFVLDPDFKMVVCSFCVKDKKSKKNQAELDALKAEEEKKRQEELSKRPPGWDEEDEYLERAYAKKQKDTVKVETLSDGKVKYKCPFCNYQFVYDPVLKKPGVCPYCSAGISKFRTS